MLWLADPTMFSAFHWVLVHVFFRVCFCLFVRFLCLIENKLVKISTVVKGNPESWSLAYRIQQILLSDISLSVGSVRRVSLFMGQEKKKLMFLRSKVFDYFFFFGTEYRRSGGGVSQHQFSDACDCFHSILTKCYQETYNISGNLGDFINTHITLLGTLVTSYCEYSTTQKIGFI